MVGPGPKDKNLIPGLTSSSRVEDSVFKTSQDKAIDEMMNRGLNEELAAGIR